MELVIYGAYVEIHLQRLTASQYSRVSQYCENNFVDLGYEEVEEARNSILIDAWLHSAGETETLTSHSMPLIVYPTEGDYNQSRNSFKKIHLCQILGIDILMPDFTISGHYWSDDRVWQRHRGAASPELSIMNTIDRRADIKKKTIRIRKRKHSMVLVRDAMIFCHQTYWNRAQVCYELPCQERDFLMSNLVIEVVKVGVPILSVGIVQRVSYDGQLLSYTDFRNWPGWELYDYWLPGE